MFVKCHIGNPWSSQKLPIRPTTEICATTIVASMAPQPRIGPKRPLRVYLRDHRNDADITQEQLAGRLGHGVDKSTVSRWENMKRVPNLNIVAAIAEALGKSLEEMFSPPKPKSRPGPPTPPAAAPASAEAIAIEVAKLLRRRRR